MISIAIDGPSGAGKSTISRYAAHDLGYIYIDTGALYRAIGLFAINDGADLSDAKKMHEILSLIRLELKFLHGEQRVILNDDDVSDIIRTPEVSLAASSVSALPEVREYLLDLQRDIAKNNNVIMDGRDIGTVILPDANVKIFLTADQNERARRRFEELNGKGGDVTFEAVLEDMKKRDEQDSSRAAAPLRQAHDAILVDTTGMDLEESIKLVLKTIKEHQ